MQKRHSTTVTRKNESNFAKCSAVGSIRTEARLQCKITAKNSKTQQPINQQPSAQKGREELRRRREEQSRGRQRRGKKSRSEQRRPEKSQAQPKPAKTQAIGSSLQRRTAQNGTEHQGRSSSTTKQPVQSKAATTLEAIRQSLLSSVHSSRDCNMLAAAVCVPQNPRSPATYNEAHGQAGKPQQCKHSPIARGARIPTRCPHLRLWLCPPSPLVQRDRPEKEDRSRMSF